MSNPIPGVSFWLYLKLLKHFSLDLETKWLYVSTHVIGEMFIGVCSSFEIFRSLKVSSNRQKFVTFHQGSILTNFKISNVSGKRKCIHIFSHSHMVLIYSNVYVNFTKINNFLFALLNLVRSLASNTFRVFEYCTR